MGLVSYPVSCGILVPQPGTNPESPGLEGEFLTTGPPGKSGTSMAFVAIEMDEADLWKDRERFPRYWLSGKSKLYNNT